MHFQCFNEITHQSPIVLLDRDNTINVDEGYTYRIEDFKFVNQAIQLINFLSINELPVVIVSNQSGINLGKFGFTECINFNTHVASELSKLNVKTLSAVFCPHSPDEKCFCRKPKTKMVELVSRIYSCSTSSMLFVGDAKSDELMAAASKLAFININSRFLNNQLHDWLLSVAK